MLKLLFKLLQNYYAKYLLTIFSIVGGYLSLVLLDIFSRNHQTFCLFKSITGIPCPGCGMGRATLSLLKGNIPLSFSYNILCIPFTLAITVSLFWLSVDILRKKETFYKFIKQEISNKYKFLLIAIIFIDWTINIIRL